MTRFQSFPVGAHFLLPLMLLLAMLVSVVQPQLVLGQDADGESRVADIEAAKASLAKINSAIDSGDFSAAVPYLTKKGESELALWVTSFAIMLNDPQISQGYPDEFDSIGAAVKAPVEKYELAIDLADADPEEVTNEVLSLLDKDGNRWDIVNELWGLAKDSPMEMVLIRGEVQRSGVEDDAIFLQVARQAPGTAKKYDAGAAPSVAKFVEEDDVWKFDGLDAKKTESVRREHESKLARMPPTIADPTFEGKTADGDAVGLADYEGKVLVIDFWGTWCSPCIDKLPKLEKIREAFEPHGFEIVGIALDDAETLGEYLKEYPLPWKNVSDDGSLKEQFGVKGYPTLFVINKDKQHVASNLEMNDLIDEIAKQLGLPLEDFSGLKDELVAMKKDGH